MIIIKNKNHDKCKCVNENDHDIKLNGGGGGGERDDDVFLIYFDLLCHCYHSLLLLLKSYNVIKAQRYGSDKWLVFYT